MDFEPGDIAACHGTDWTSRLIRWGTFSIFPPADLRVGPSHVAILYRWRDSVCWGESTTLCPRPCLIRGEPVSGAQCHIPADRIADYVDAGGHVDIYRLTPIFRLVPDESRLLTRLFMNEFLDQPVRYDLKGALRSGTRLYQISSFFPGANLDELFCSELVAAFAMRLNRMNQGNPSRYHPARLLRELVRSGIYRRVATFDGTGVHLHQKRGPRQ